MLLRLFWGQGHVPHHDQAELTSLSRAEGGRSPGSTLCTAHPALAGCGRAQPPGWCWLGTCSCGTACTLGSWNGGDSPATCVPLLASSLGTAAGHVPWQGCQAAQRGGMGTMGLGMPLCPVPRHGEAVWGWL